MLSGDVKPGFHTVVMNADSIAQKSSVTTQIYGNACRKALQTFLPDANRSAGSWQLNQVYLCLQFACRCGPTNPSMTQTLLCMKTGLKRLDIAHCRKCHPTQSPTSNIIATPTAFLITRIRFCSICRLPAVPLASTAFQISV